MYEKVPVGRSLDTLVAERVLGWRFRWRDEDAVWCWHVPDGSVVDKLPAFSSDIAAAWLVVERMVALGFEFELDYNPFIKAAPWTAFFFRTPNKGISFPDGGSTAAEAICRAAVRAVERTAEYEQRLAELRMEQDEEA